MNTILVQLINDTKPEFVRRQISEDINFEAEAGFAIQALSSEYSTKIALQNRQSVIDAVTNVSAIGVSLNPAKKQAYLVPRSGKICLDISYMGLIDLAVATGSILWAQCILVYEQDDFILKGFDEPPHHKFNPFSKDRGLIIGAYACVKTPSSDYLTHTMPISDIYAIRDRSEGWKAGKATPWKSDEGEMIKKTVIKQAYKYWPKTSPQLENAIHHLNTDTVEGIAEMQPTRRPVSQITVIEAEEFLNVDDIIKDLEEQAEKGTTEFRIAWKNLNEKEKSAVGIENRNRIDLISKKGGENV